MTINPQMTLLGVDFKDDRVEVRLGATNAANTMNIYNSLANNQSAEGSGKIKYMVGKDYRNWSADQLMEVIARGIRIPSLERPIELKSEFEALRANLQEAESKYNAPGTDTHSKLINAIALRQVLEKIQKNRVEFIAMGKSDPQAGTYSEKIRALNPEISKLSEEVHKERIAHIRDQLKAQLPQLSEIQNQVRQKSPSSLTEWQQRSDILVKYSTLLEERQKLLIELKNENEPPAAEDYKYLDESRAQIVTARNGLELAHQQLELADLTAQYRLLTKKRAQMLDSYTRAFGTPKERAALQELIAVLGQIVTNRDRAAGLGDKTATAQLIQCRAEVEKYKRR